MLQAVKSIPFKTHGDDRGQLIALETLSESVPFDVKRIYYIYDTTPGTVRGKHAHKLLRQVLICVNGACTIECDFGNGRAVQSYTLDRPDRGLLVEGMVWRNMTHFSKNAVLLVLASEHYDESDYIRDYAVFSQTVREG